MSDKHKIRLDWKGGKKQLSLTSTMTMKELAGIASNLAGANAVKLSLPPKQDALSLNDELAIDVIPNMTKVQVEGCSSKRDRDDEASPASATKKRRAKQSTSNSADVVDLTGDDSQVVAQIESDEALARRLEQEEAAADGYQQHEASTFESDAALAERLQEQERAEAEAMNGHPPLDVGALGGPPAMNGRFDPQALAAMLGNNGAAAAAMMVPAHFAVFGQGPHRMMGGAGFAPFQNMGIPGAMVDGSRVQRGQVDNRDPTTVTQAEHWIYRDGPEPYINEEVYGKWLIFCSPDTTNRTWRIVSNAVASGELQAVQAKVATTYGREYKGANQHVICVYTSQASIDKVGLLLIPLIRDPRHPLKYKSDAATLRGEYADEGHKDISERFVYWNNGRPSFVKAPKPPKITKKASLSKATKVAAQNPALSHTFNDRLVTVWGMRRLHVPEALLEIGNQVTLTREPENEHDPNSIRINLPSSSRQIGHVPREEAALLAPWLDRGLINIGSAKIHRCDKDETGTIVALALILEGRACPEASDVLNQF